MSPRPSVLYSFGPPTPDANPYTTLLGERVQGAGADVQYFSWRTALLGQYDVMHVHWPEALVRPYRANRLSPVVTAIKLMLAVALLVLTRARRRKLVWTVHNRRPHEAGSWAERAYIRLFLRLVDHRIFLNQGETDESGRPSSVILHPDYAPVAPVPQVEIDPERMLLFGHLRPYKGVDRMISLVGSAPDAGSLLVVGHAADPAYGASLVASASASANVEVQTRLVAQEELNRLIAASALVVLPYAYAYNSGSLLLALTLHAPVIIRRSPTTEAIRGEVGPGWVTTFEGELDLDDLRQALEASRRLDRDAGPDLSRRSWDECADTHVALYRSLTSS
jgi:beta-1,4-mannosyltransferase